MNIKRTLALSCTIALLLPAVFAQTTTCTAEVATIHEHIGEHVVFCGTPAQVSAPTNVKGDPVYLNFGGKFPHSTFSVVIWGDIAGKQRSKLEKRYTGKALQIKGYVMDRDGKPQINLRELGDIEVVK